MESNYESMNTQEALAHLADWNPRSRHQAREKLVFLGKAALPLLFDRLNDSDANVRWEAVKALGEIGNPLAVEPLVKLLKDDEVGVRWATMRSLIMLGRGCMEPILLELTKENGSACVRHGVHHILHAFSDKGMLTGIEKEVMYALEGFTPTVDAAELANEVLITEFGHVRK